MEKINNCPVCGSEAIEAWNNMLCDAKKVYTDNQEKAIAIANLANNKPVDESSVCLEKKNDYLCVSYNYYNFKVIIEYAPSFDYLHVFFSTKDIKNSWGIYNTNKVIEILRSIK